MAAKSRRTKKPAKRPEQPPMTHSEWNDRILAIAELVKALTPIARAGIAAFVVAALAPDLLRNVLAVVVAKLLAQ